MVVQDFFWFSLVDNTTTLQTIKPVALGHSGETVGDDQNGFLAMQGCNGIHHLAFSVLIKGAGCFVQNQH